MTGARPRGVRVRRPLIRGAAAVVIAAIAAMALIMVTAGRGHVDPMPLEAVG